MKNLKSYLACLAVFALFLTSCSKDEPVQNETSEEVASLTFSSVLADFARSGNSSSTRQSSLPECSADDPAYAEISLVYGASEIAVNTTVDILEDSEGLFTDYSEDLEIPVPSGEDWVSVSLRSFEVYNEGGTLIWKAPMDESEYDDFVTDALPIDFQLRAGSKNYQDVEVLCFDDRMVNKYGYQFFDITPEELRELCFFANYCSDEGRHFAADYNLDLWYYVNENEQEVIYTDRSPMVGKDGDDYYAEPLCFAIPEPQMGEGANDPYLYYEVTLIPWEGNYTFPGEAVTTSGFLSWNDIKDLLDTDSDGDIEDNSDANYWHVFLNCGDDDGGAIDSDEDGVPNSSDNCPNVANEGQENSDGDSLGNVCDNCPEVTNQDQANFDGDDLGDACDPDDDNDEVMDDVDQCDNTPQGVEVYPADGDQPGCPISSSECPPAASEGCLQIADTNLSIELGTVGGANPVTPIGYLEGGTLIQVGEVEWNLLQDGSTSNLELIFTMDENFTLTAAGITLLDYNNTTSNEAVREACVGDLNNESTTTLTIENLGPIEEIFPITFDLTTNVCPAAQ